MIANFRADTRHDVIKYERAGIATFNGRSGSFWTKWAEEGVYLAWVRCGQVFVPGMRPTRADVVDAFNGGLS
jgi:hypothetical protein